MVKGNPKASATSATRKKHAKKHGPPEDVSQNETRKAGGKGGKKNKEPRVKMYIPPVKPAPVQPDPLETTGLAHSLPADLVVVLRNLSKKAQMTKIRALDELQAAWVDRCTREQDEVLSYTLAEMLPVWLHHLPALLLNPSRRIRLAAATLHSNFLSIPDVHDRLLFFLREQATSSQMENILGTLCLAANDVDRSVASMACKAWEETIVTTPSTSTTGDASSPNGHFFLDETAWSSLTSFIQRVALDPGGTYLYFNPVVQPAPLPIVHHKKGGEKGSQFSKPMRDEGDQTPRSKTDEQEENDQDRNSRLRIGAFGAGRRLLGTQSPLSDDLLLFYSNPGLWTSLCSRGRCPWIEMESFGFSQPNVRKAAWALLQSLLTSHQDEMLNLFPTLSIAILRSAWVETDTAVQAVMWPPLLTFLKHFPQSWASSIVDEDEGSASEDDAVQAVRKPSEAYSEFLQFLELGCSGSPIQGYPIVVIVLSTIPSSVFPPPLENSLSHFFMSFWSAVDGRALSSLHRTAASSAFLSSLLECLVFLLRRIYKSGEVFANADTLVKTQFSRVWTEISTQRLSVEAKTIAKVMVQTLEALVDLDRILFDAAWETLTIHMKQSSKEEKEEKAKLVSQILKHLSDWVSLKNGDDTWNDVRHRVTVLLKEVLSEQLEGCKALICESVDGRANFTLLINLLEQFEEELFVSEDFASALDHLLTESDHALRLLSLSPQFLLSYLLHRKDQERCLSVWHSLLSSIASGQTLDPSVINKLLEAAQQGNLPQYLKPQRGGLEQFMGDLLKKAIGGETNSNEMVILKKLFLSANYFLTPRGFDALLQTTLDTYTTAVRCVTEGQDVSVYLLDTVIELIEVVLSSFLQSDKMANSLLPAVFLHAYLSPLCAQLTVPTNSQVAATVLWQKSLQETNDETRKEILRAVVRKLRSFIGETEVYPLPQIILQLISGKPPGLQVNLIKDIFPSAVELDARLDELSQDPIDSSIAVLDDLLPTEFKSKFKVNKAMSVDRHGFAPYARIVNGLSLAFLDDHQLAKNNLWALRHLIALSLYAQDFKQTIGLPRTASPVFNEKVTEKLLDEVIDRVRQISVYLFKFLDVAGAARDGDDGGWRREVVVRILAAPETVLEGFSNAQTLLFDFVTHAKENDTLRDTRILKVVLESLLADGLGDNEADLWIQLARYLEKASPQTSMTIISVLISRGAEPPRLDRYRNELASSLLGIQPQRANSEGLLGLRKLAAAAPDPVGDVVFLPTPRAVNVLKALQTWALAEDGVELGEEVESAMLPIFVHLAPILQTVSGSHWPFMFDVLESVLERSAESEEESDIELDEDEQNRKRMEDGATLVALARATRFLLVIEELAGGNKPFMEQWKTRRVEVMKSVMKLGILNRDARMGSSKPFSMCRELVLSVLTHLPSSPLFNEHTLEKMIHLVGDTSFKVQKMAYTLLKEAAKKRTEYFVIEVGASTSRDEEDEAKVSLPTQLADLLMREVNVDGRSEEDQATAFGFLLAWMVVFDSFETASDKVRSSYVDQLKRSNVVVDHFIPCFLNLLRLDQGGLSKSFKLDIWAVNAFHIDLYEPGSSHAIAVLTAYVYYRALLSIPSIIRNWVLECKDRQLTNAVMTYTSTHFSPLFIKAELDHVKTNVTSGELVDEKMNVKILSTSGSGGSSGSAGGVGGEVVVNYAVDDLQLEIRVRIPSDLPLHRIEVKDVKRVGVDENRWRAWVLGVQQTIWAHNGRIVDGLSLFKNNVALHFEGQVDCAICYSVISVMDGSLPKKPCKTCKNRFHAACLYKWFKTSHTSSCPLCRSDII